VRGPPPGVERPWLVFRAGASASAVRMWGIRRLETEVRSCGFLDGGLAGFCGVWGGSSRGFRRGFLGVEKGMKWYRYGQRQLHRLALEDSALGQDDVVMNL
jgi:hypothetical protein